MPMLLNRSCHAGAAPVLRALAVAAALVAAAGVRAATPTLSLAQTPLTISNPSHPQVLFSIGNSESMDGNVSGAIMAGSGSLTGTSIGTALTNSSSPSCYSVPSGFTPPLSAAGTGGCTAGNAPYTVTQGGNFADNSPSRLNVAKQGIYAVMQNYLPSVDFALEDYSTSGLSVFTTWVYYMSPFVINTDGSVSSSNFGLTATSSANTLANPCYNYKALSTANPVEQDCASMDATLFSNNLSTSPFLNLAGPNSELGVSSDNPLVNDVLYAGGGLPPVFTTYNSAAGSSPNPANPYPNNCVLAICQGYSLSQYNANLGNILTSYSATSPNIGGFGTFPTNAGFIPFPYQVMYVERGFGYGANQSNTSGSVVVPMQSAGQPATQAAYNTALAAFGTMATANTPLGVETNSTGTTEIKASAGQSSLPGLMNAAKQYFDGTLAGTTKPTPSETGCPATPYVVLTTDGLPTLDFSNQNWPPLGGNSTQSPPNGYGVTASFNTTTGALTTTNDQALTDTITYIGKLLTDTTPIKTFVIGLGAGVNPANNPAASQALTAMAVAGGTGSANSTPNTYNNNIPYGYFPATSPAALVSDLQTILAQIQQTTQSVATAAVDSTGLQSGNLLYQAQFSTSNTYLDWTGDLFAECILVVGAASSDPTQCPAITTGTAGTVVVGGGTNPPTTIWDAQSLLDAATPSNRVIATWQPQTASAIPFEWASTCTAACTTGIAPTSTLGAIITSNTIVPVAGDSTDATQGLDRVNYLRGVTSKEMRNGGVYRNRTHILGDIIDSSPIYIGTPSGNSLASSYTTFKNSADITARPAVLYVGANDGMLHAFNASTGAELFAFIPNGGASQEFSTPYTLNQTATQPNGNFGNLPTLTSQFYNSNHLYFADGSPQAADVQFSDASWHTVLVGGENAGGQTIYALDVTYPQNITSETALAGKVLWEFSDSDMGYSYSQPAIAAINASPGSAVIFGNGYDSPNNKPVLYVVNPQTGAQIAKIDLCAQVTGACNTALVNGLSSVTVVNSAGELSAPADTVYAGDLQGNMWRVFINSTATTAWTVNVLSQARDASGNVQPITVAPAVSLNPQYPQRLGTMVEFGTGQLLTTADLSSTNVQTIYGIFDPGSETAGSLPSTKYARSTTGSGLVQQTLTPSTVTGSNGVTYNVYTVSGNSVNLATNPGWYIDLTATVGTGGGAAIAAGTREVTAPKIEAGGGLVLTAFDPTISSCTVSGTSYLFVLNFATGGSFTQPQFALPPGSNNLSSTTTSSGSNAVGVSLGTVYATSPNIISSNQSAAKGLKLITESALGAGATGSNASSTVVPIYDRGGNSQRTAWWEIQQ